MAAPKKQNISVYYDGLCQLCSREIQHYRKSRGSENIRFVDITSPEFQAQKEGVDPVQVHKVMHVRRSDGSLATEVDAFIAIWSVLPSYQWAARLAQQPGVRHLLNAGYQVFARVRPWLPRRKAPCADSPYCELPSGGGRS